MKIDGIPDELNDHPIVKDAPDLPAIIKSAINAQSLIGNSIRIPGDGASDADRTEFRQKLERVGMVPKDKFQEFVRPEKPTGYELKDPPKDAETVVTQQQIDDWKAWAHDTGLSPAQFEKFATTQINARLLAAKAQQERFGEVDTVLKGKYGEAGVNSAKERALAAAQRFGGEDLVARLSNTPDAPTLIALAEVGKLFQERGMGDLTPQRRFTESRDEAEIKLGEIMANKDHPFHNRFANRKAYEAAAVEVMRLRALALGEQPPQGDYLFDREVS